MLEGYGWHTAEVNETHVEGAENDSLVAAVELCEGLFEETDPEGAAGIAQTCLVVERFGCSKGYLGGARQHREVVINNHGLPGTVDAHLDDIAP